MGIRNLSIYAGSSFKIFGLGINVILDVLGDDAMCDIMSNQGIPNCVTPRVYKARCMKYGSKDAYTLNVVLYFCPNIRWNSPYKYPSFLQKDFAPCWLFQK